jgi:uncharacterized membrane protein
MVTPLPAAHDTLPIADAGRDFVTGVGLPSEFRGVGAAPDSEIARYEWDFDGDGRYDYQSTRTGLASHLYHVAGVYQAVLRVRDAQGSAATDAITVIVTVGVGAQTYLPERRLQPLPVLPPEAPADGLVERYAVMINGGHETRFWEDVTFMYSTLTGDYGLPAERILLLNDDGTDPYGNNPGDMIDSAAVPANIKAAFDELSFTMDGDDELFVWVTDHGQGYNGPQLQSYGFLGSYASVDPGDEQDYLESDFKLRSLCTYGDYAYPHYNHGMDVFKVYRRYSSSQGAYQIYRNKFVSAFSGLYFESHGYQSDADIYIERLVDYLQGDTDRDGYVETGQGEVLDYDGDGQPPYDHATGVFDEDDWGDLDYYEDNFNNINSAHPGDNYLIFDHGFDNHLDIDLDYIPGQLEVDGTDLDNQGLFDGIDANQDGDMDDWVSIDEAISLWRDELYDDELATLLNRIPGRLISVFMEPCFSGGFIKDLSAVNRVISTATEEEDVSYGTLFVELFTSALHRQTPAGAPVNADSDGNGHVSMREAFNYAARNDYYPEVPQYDDNGDGLGHPYPIPQGGDGPLGAVAYLESFFGLELSPLSDARSADAGRTVTYTLHLTNSGSLADTFDLTVSGNSWTTVAPGMVGPLAATEEEKVEVTVSIPSSASHSMADTAGVTIASQGDATLYATAILTTTVNSVYGVTVHPTLDARSGDPGQAITYTLQVTNIGNVPDTFSVTVNDHAWQTGVPSTVGPLAAGESATILATVEIPTTAAGGASDAATVAITSQGDGSLSTTATLSTTANNVYGLTVVPVADSRSGDPGETVTYTLQVTNRGNITDTFGLAINGHAWQTSAPGMVGPLAAGERTTVDVTVEIPTGAAGDASDTAAVAIASQGSGDQSATVLLTTTANHAYGVTMTPNTDTRSGDPGQTVTYTLRLTNSGNVVDSFSVTLSGHTWQTSTPGIVGPLAAGEGVTIDVIVEIPTGAVGGASDAVTVTIASQSLVSQSPQSIETDESTANPEDPSVVGGVARTDVSNSNPVNAQASIRNAVVLPGAPSLPDPRTRPATFRQTLSDPNSLTLSDQSWPTSEPVTAHSPLNGDPRDMIRAIPPLASMPDIALDTVSAFVSLMADAATSATATLTTTANIIYGVRLESVIDAQSDAPGQAVTYTLQVDNSGNMADTIVLALDTTHAWPTTLSHTSLSLDEGQGTTVYLQVLIPPDVISGDRDEVTVTATSQGDTATVDSITLATAVGWRIYLPLVVRDLS